MPINVAIVEDEPVTLEGIKAIVDSSDELFCCGTFSNAQTFKEKFKHLNADVVLMDIDLKAGMNGIECVESLYETKGKVQFLMCTNIEDPDKIVAALKVGATGYILKNTTDEKIINSIIELHNGGSPMSPLVARKITEVFKADKKNAELFNRLTEKEKEAIELLRKGFQYKEVADKQGVAVDTIRKRIRMIYEKLQVHNRTDAINKLYPKTGV